MKKLGARAQQFWEKIFVFLASLSVFPFASPILSLYFVKKVVVGGVGPELNASQGPGGLPILAASLVSATYFLRPNSVPVRVNVISDSDFRIFIHFIQNFSFITCNH